RLALTRLLTIEVLSVIRAGDAPRVESVCVNRRERTDAARLRVKLDVLNGSMQQALVGRELLQRADACARANDGDQIARLHLFIHKFVQRLADKIHALERQPKIINDERKREIGRASCRERV